MEGKDCTYPAYAHKSLGCTVHLMYALEIITYNFNKKYIFVYYSFVTGDVFVIEDNVNESWYWGRLQRTSERGLIPKAYLIDAVR